MPTNLSTSAAAITDSMIFSVTGYESAAPSKVLTLVGIAQDHERLSSFLDRHRPHFNVLSMTSLAQFKQVVATLERIKHDGAAEGIAIFDDQ